MFANNNKASAEVPLLTHQPSMKELSPVLIHRHRPGCPKYVPPTEIDALSTELFSHPTRKM